MLEAAWKIEMARAAPWLPEEAWGSFGLNLFGARIDWNKLFGSPFSFGEKLTCPQRVEQTFGLGTQELATVFIWTWTEVMSFADVLWLTMLCWWLVHITVLYCCQYSWQPMQIWRQGSNALDILLTWQLRSCRFLFKQQISVIQL